MTMKTTLKLPIGVENFEEIRAEDYYYVDKTGLIRDLLKDGGKVTLFTRPRRFGKSLNMSMLKYFFEYGCDGRSFEGLEIAGERELCEAHMGKYPVISITLKDINARDYTAAKTTLKYVIGDEALRFGFLKESDRLSGEEKEQYSRLVAIGGEGQPMFPMPDDVLERSLRLLSRLLRKHYGQKVVLLIDEYDVPLDKAQRSGYYDEMVATIRGLLSQALKSNDDLFFAVLTGCLRISKESILLDGILNGAATAQSPQIKISLWKQQFIQRAVKNGTLFSCIGQEMQYDGICSRGHKKKRTPPTKVWFSSHPTAGSPERTRHTNDTSIYRFLQAEPDSFFRQAVV